MKSLLDEFGLYQYVTFPTHVRGHTLDLVIGDNRHPQIIRNTRTLSHGSVESNHFPVCFNIMFKKPGKVKKIVHYRKWSSLDVKQFEDNIKENISHLDTLTEVNDLVSFYNDVLSSAVTTQLPLKRKTITEHPNCPYYNDTLRAEKQKRRSLERQWRRTSLSVHRQLYTDQCKLVNRLLRQTKANYYKDKLKECKTDQKALFKVIDDLMYRSSTEGGIFSQASSLENRALAQRLNDFFIEKIDKIREDLHQEKLMSYIPEHIPKPVPAEFSSFVPLSDTDIHKLIISRPTKHCDLDPIPTWLLKQCSGTLLPIIKSIINASLLSGLFPDNLKEAILKPLLKKLGLDPECFKNLRPISNLAFISKLIECAVCNHYNTHIFNNDIAEIYQSAYKASHRLCS